MLKKLLDSQKIRYVLSSALSFCVDTGLYYLLLLFFGLEKKSLLQIIARIFSSFFNFNMNKYFAYRKKEEYFQDLWKYYCVCIPQAGITVFLTNLFQNLVGVKAPFAAAAVKVCVDMALFVASYFVQKVWVFRSKE